MIWHRRKRRIEDRCRKASEALDSDDRNLIANALRVAADQYDADGVAHDQSHARVAHHFEDMAQRCRVMAEAFEL